MADQDWNGLPYGHFGNATYQADERTWQFEKVPDLPRILHPIGDPETAVPSSRFSLSVDDTDRSTEQPNIRYDRETTNLTKLVPALQPAVRSLQPLLYASEAVESASSRHDPLHGTLSSFGRIFDASIRRSTQVAAFVSGPTGSDLRVVQVQLQKQGWDDSRDVWLEVPVISGEEALWRSGGAPIQQVQFAQPLESGENLLAVRTTSRVLIFKPVLRKAGPNRLHLKPLFEVSTTDNGGVPYADVAFNPWFPRQFAIVDTAARWRVWEFRSRESSDASCVYASAIDEEAVKKSDLNDGWAHLTWICSPSVVLVVTRRAVTLHDITATPSKLQDVGVGMSGNSGWVLDVLIIPSSPTRTLVLTTTHVHVISVEDRNGEVRASSIMRIRHFKSSEDITLRLALFRDEEGMLSAYRCRATLTNNYSDLTVILRSAMSSTLLSYRLILDDIQKTALHDPVQFRLRSYGTGSTDVSNIADLHIQSVAVAEKRSTNVDDTLLGRLRKDGCRFVALTTFEKDLSISTLLHLSSHQPEQRIPDLTSPTWKSKLLGTSAKIKDEFVVDDEFVVADTVLSTSAPVARYVRERRARAERLFGQEWTLHYEKTATKVEKRALQMHNVDDVLMQTQEMLEQTPEHGFQPMRTLLEVSAGEITMSDLDRASAQIARLTAMAPLPNSQLPGEMDDEENNTRIVLRPLGDIPLPGLPSIDDAADSVTPAYDAIISYWIAPLHSKVSGRVRLAKEQLARRLAAELTLARHVFCIEDTEEQLESQQDAKQTQESQSWDLPMHPASSQLYNPYASQLQSQSQSVLPTPSPTGTPSVTTASSRATTFSSAEVSNLMKFTTFTKPTPSALPRNLTKLLAHWTPGTDPEAYDWITTSRSISQRTREEEADSQLTEKQRARAHRKAERYIRRQRKEAEASQMQMMASSQMPELVVSASQPLPPPSARKPATAAVFSQPQGRSGMAPPAFGGVLNSSQHMGPGAASQAVPGRFGGRPPVKKKRKQGF
jgi:RNA polymerase I-specific transcription initiation factor RRN6